MCLHHILPFQLKAQCTGKCELAVIRHHNWSVIFFLASVLAWTGLIMPWHLSITPDWFCLLRIFSVRLSKVTKTRREQHRYCSGKLYSIYVACQQTYIIGSLRISERATKLDATKERLVDSQQTISYASSFECHFIGSEGALSFHIYIHKKSLFRSSSEDT